MLRITAIFYLRFVPYPKTKRHREPGDRAVFTSVGLDSQHKQLLTILEINHCFMRGQDTLANQLVSLVHAVSPDDDRESIVRFREDRVLDGPASGKKSSKDRN